MPGPIDNPGHFSSVVAITPAVSAAGTMGADGIVASSDNGVGVVGTSQSGYGISGGGGDIGVYAHNLTTPTNAVYLATRGLAGDFRGDVDVWGNGNFRGDVTVSGNVTVTGDVIL